MTGSSLSSLGTSARTPFLWVAADSPVFPTLQYYRGGAKGRAEQRKLLHRRAANGPAGRGCEIEHPHFRGQRVEQAGPALGKQLVVDLTAAISQK
jgi:hypothetical protein